MKKYSENDIVKMKECFNSVQKIIYDILNKSLKYEDINKYLSFFNDRYKDFEFTGLIVKNLRSIYLNQASCCNMMTEEIVTKDSKCLPYQDCIKLLTTVREFKSWDDYFEALQRRQFDDYDQERDTKSAIAVMYLILKLQEIVISSYTVERNDKWWDNVLFLTSHLTKYYKNYNNGLRDRFNIFIIDFINLWSDEIKADRKFA